MYVENFILKYSYDVKKKLITTKNQQQITQVNNKEQQQKFNKMYKM